MFKRKTRRSRAFNKNNQVINFEDARAERKKRREAAGRIQNEKRVAIKDENSKRKAIKRNRRRLTYTAIIMFIIAVIGVSMYSIISVQMQRSDVLAENAALKAEKNALSEEFNNVDNQEYVEQQARTQLKMIKPGEVLYVLPKKDATSASEVSNGGIVE